LQGIITITLPFFALIACGWLAGRRQILSEPGIAGLNAFVFYFALPCLIFSSLASRHVADIANPSFMLAYGAAGLFMFAATAAVGRLLFKTTLGESALLGQAGSVGNVGYLALPLIIALLGEAATLPVVLGWLVDLVVLVPLSIALLEIDRHDTGASADFVRTVVRGVALNPFVLSIAAGVLWSAGGLTLPAPVESFTSLLGRAAGPAALFALGATLSQRKMADAMAEAAYMSAAKLFVYPAVMWGTMTQIFQIEPLWATAAVLTAAAPVAGNVYIIASSFGVYVLRSSTAILISTALAVLSFSGLVAFLI